MFFEEQDADHLKTWLVTRLTDISDADSDVLADYVLALLRTDSDEGTLKADVVTNLEDFLKENTPAFVDEIFSAIKAKSHKPGHVVAPSQPQSSTPLNATNSATSLSQAAQPQGPNRGPHQPSKKRSYNETREDGRGDAHYTGGERQKRQIRGGRGGRGGNMGQRNGFPNAGSPHSMGGFQPPQFPQMPLDFPGFDMNDPMSAMMAMQAMGMQLPNMPGFPPGAEGFDSSSTQKKLGACHDYDTKGVCLRGESCPFSHGSDRVIVANGEEYDPSNATMMDTSPTSPNSNGSFPNAFRGGERGRGRGRGRGSARGDRGAHQSRRGRSDISRFGPNHDRAITTIVIEHIPDDKFNESAIREFFAEFGSISEVTLQNYKQLALVKYETWEEAKRAHESPKVIFDNRFVKVYWYKPNTTSDSGKGSQPPQAATEAAEVAEEEPFDQEEFEQKTLAAQKRLEEKKSQMQEMTAKREALDKQREALAAKQALERQRLIERINAKGGGGGAGTSDTEMSDGPGVGGSTGNTNGEASTTESSNPRTAALKAQLATLEAEAKSLGLNASSPSSSSTWPSRGRGRGGFRGGGSYRGWESFDPSYRGRGSSMASSSYHHRGMGGGRAAPAAGGGRYNLDNRTKRIVVTISSPDTNTGNDDGAGPAKTEEWTNFQDEALRQWLLLLGADFEDVASPPALPTPDTTDAAAAAADQQQKSDKTRQIITFKDRPTAEQFLFSGPKSKREVPNLGPVDLTWWNGAATNSAVKPAAIPAVASDSSNIVSKDFATAPATTTTTADTTAGGDSSIPSSSSLNGTNNTSKQTSSHSGANGKSKAHHHHNHAEMDYDVADEEDDDDRRWMDT